MDHLKGLFSALFIFLLVGMLSYFVFTQKEPPSPVKMEEVPVASPSLALSSVQPTPSLRAPVSKIPDRMFRKIMESQFSPPRGPRKLEGSVVEFKMAGDYAVAFGDVLLGKPDPGSKLKNGIAEVRSPEVWPTREIPYAIAPQLLNPKRVERAVDYFNKYTSVRFVPYQGQKDAIVFEAGEKHCYSYLGRIGGLQPIRLSENCKWPEIAHEMMHALGFIHEQSRTDRDQYVEVLWDNIDADFHSQFAVAPETLNEPLRGTNFDFTSVMLYRSDSFAKMPGLATLKARGPEPIAPTPEGLSAEDIRRVNRLYALHE